MNNHLAVSVGTALACALVITGCAADSSKSPENESAPIALNAWSAPCNLELALDDSGESWVARYSQPTLSMQTPHEKYGDLIANDACSDAIILRWQEARQESGQPDAICRVVWETDSDGFVRDVGCAVPVVMVKP